MLESECNNQGSVMAITGGTKGMGAAITESWRGAGAIVVMCARKLLEKILTVEGRVAEFQSCDVRKGEAVSSWNEGIVDKHGSFDVWVKKAGGTLELLKAESSPRVFD
jgi:Short-chain alcohol dehydrogenase of unknown specificity